MIDRLVSALHEVAALTAPALRAPAASRLLADCADAVRLELDCPQQTLTPDQRDVLHHLGDLLDGAAGAGRGQSAGRYCRPHG